MAHDRDIFDAPNMTLTRLIISESSHLHGGWMLAQASMRVQLWLCLVIITHKYVRVTEGV